MLRPYKIFVYSAIASASKPKNEMRSLNPTYHYYLTPPLPKLGEGVGDEGPEPLLPLPTGRGIVLHGGPPVRPSRSTHAGKGDR